MKISPATESVLIVEITDAIQKASFNKLRVLVFPKDWDEKVLNRVDENFRRSILEILDGQKFKKLVEHFIKMRILSGGGVYPLQGPKKLVNLEGFKDSLDVAKGIVEDIALLPAQYIFATPILEEFSARAARDDLDFQLNDRCSIVSAPVLSKISRPPITLQNWTMKQRAGCETVVRHVRMKIINYISFIEQAVL